MYGYYKKMAREFTGSFTGKGISFGGSLMRPEATGYGNCYFLLNMLATRGIDIKGKRVAVSGSGNVANYTAKKLLELGAKVVSMSDSNGCIIAPDGLNVGDKVRSGSDADIKPGNALALADIPVGTVIHNIELYPGKGGQLVRSAGNMAQLMAKENGYALLRLPSGELRNVSDNCMATIGVVSNLDHENVNYGKAGRVRHMGVRPTVRGSVMNPNDHPHGGGEGKSPVGRPGPVTPWGKPALGYKTRKIGKSTDKFIVKRRNSK